MKSEYFKIEELVDPDTLILLGEQECWKLFLPDALEMLDGIRRFFGVPITVNNWKWNGDLKFRGYRPSSCKIGTPNSYHRKGMAFDFDVKGLGVDVARGLIFEHQDDSNLILIRRIEADVNWVHVDIGNNPSYAMSGIHLFKA
jgi:hypothetical protein